MGPQWGLPCPQSFPWRLSRGNGLLMASRERQYSIAAALPKPCGFEGFYGVCAGAGEKGPFFLTEYSTTQLSSQLTLLQEVGRAPWRGGGHPEWGPGPAPYPCKW